MQDTIETPAQLGTDRALPAVSSPSPRPVAHGAPEQSALRLDVLRSLQLHRRLALGIVLAAGVAAVVYLATQWPMYTAECRLFIQPAPPRLLEVGKPPLWPYDSNSYESFVQQQLTSALEPDVLLRAVQKLHGDAVHGKRNGDSEQAAVERLGKALKVTREGASYEIKIAAQARNANTAARIANAVAQSVAERAALTARQGDSERLAMLQEEEDRVQKALASDRAEQQNLDRMLGVAVVSPSNSDQLDMDISKVRGELVNARTAHDDAAARLMSLSENNAAQGNALKAEAEELIRTDAGLASMKTALNARRAVLISQMATLTSNHPQYKLAAEELAQIDTSLDKMMTDLRSKAGVQIQQHLRNELERTAALESQLNADLDKLTGEAAQATPRLQRSNEVAADIERQQHRFAAVDEELRNLTLAAHAPGSVSISAPALPPLHATSLVLLRNAMTILIGGVLLAIIAVLAAYNLDPRVYLAQDVEHLIGFSPMAQLPDFDQVPQEVGEEYMLRLAAAMEHAYQQGGFKSCIFTGVGPGAGVTTVASRVRTMLEGMGRNTVLVDASGSPPPADAESSAVPGGAVTTSQLVTAPDSRASTLLQQMADEMDTDTIVLTDTAPLLASGETEYLARFVDSAIVVIQSGLSTRAQLREVAQTLQRLDVAAVGFVVNRVSIEKANPSFRQSVRAVEQRLAVQNRLQTRHSPRTRPSAQHHRESAQEPSVVTDRDAANSPESTRFPGSSAQHAAGRPAGAERAAAAQPPVREQAPAAGAPPYGQRPTAEERLISELERTAEQRPASPEGPVESPTSADASRSTTVAAPAESAPPGTNRAARGRGEPERASSRSGTRQPAVPTPHPAIAETPLGSHPGASAFTTTGDSAPYRSGPTVAPASEPPHAPVAAGRPAPVNRAAGIHTPPAAPMNDEVMPDDRIPERNDAGYAAASRLGGLRNLLVSLGRRSLNKDAEFETGDSHSDLEPRFERATVRPAYPDSPQPAEEAPESGTPVRLTAQPEFLPPKPMVEVEKEKEAVRPTPTASRRDGEPDEIQTLPSWRGQYRKKRYPPMS